MCVNVCACVCVCVCVYACVCLCVCVCELLECINTGWPNRPGRPELVSHNNRFTIEVKLHQPEYLGGLTADDGLQYHVYLAYAGTSLDSEDTFGDRDFHERTDASSTSTIITIDLTEISIIGLNSLSNKYLITVIIVPTNRTLIRIAALPERSPPLQINTLCDLVG